MSSTLKLTYILLIFWKILIAGEKAITIGTGEWFPFTSENSVDSGVICKLVTAAYKTQNYEVKFEFFPWKRCEAFLQEGKVDLITPYSQNEERLKKYYYSDKILINLSSIYIRHDIVEYRT